MRVLLFALLTFLCTCARAQNLTEEITLFSVDIKTRQDATLDVTETITVVATGDQIKRGITRALHLKPLGTDGNLAPFDYEIISVSRDGKKEPYQVKKRNGLPTVFIGDKDVRLDPGSYTYVLKYRAKNQVYPVGVTDEIRWPLEGSSGSLPVRDADITIRFDRDIAIIQSACYTGTFGSTAEDCEFSQDGNVVTFVATRGLEPGEGMTVSASIAQGYFNRPVPPPPPTPFERNAVLYTMLLGFGTAFSYAYFMWRNHGVDPEGPELKLEFYPPAGISPASAGYNYGYAQGYAPTTASLTALAIKGYVLIQEGTKQLLIGEREMFTVSATERSPKPGELPAEEQALYDGIQAAGTIDLDGEYNAEVLNLSSAHYAALKEANRAITKDGRQFKGALPLAVILGATLGLAFYFALQFGFGKLVLVLGVIAAVLLFGFFIYLIQQPSLAKVTLKRELKGLKNYLSLSEKKRSALPNAPEMTQEYYQSILPYAIALGIDNDWAADLAADWAATSANQATRQHTILPYMVAGFGTRLSGSYASTTTHPASSGGGGGFASGGGSVGGGGGTGGW